VLSGIYPALVISNYQPIQVLKGRFTDSGKGLFLRKLLTVFQFTISIALLIGTILVYKQLHFMQIQELGFSPDQVIVVEGPRISDSTFYMKANSFKESLENTSNISQVSLSNSIPSREVSGMSSGFRRKEVDPNSSVLMAYNLVDEEYISLYDMEIVAGRNFDKDLDNWQSVILSEKGALELGYKDAETAIGRQMAIGSGNDNSYNIVGVVRDYHHNSLNEPMTSLCHFYEGHSSDYISIKLNSRDLEHSINQIKSDYAAFFPNNPFHYFFMDDSFAAQYEADRKTSEIVLLFSSLAIFIACLGLFGLTSFVVIKRAKEIGIRKVLGATFLNIFNLISKEFVVLVGISILIASPLSYFLLDKYLEQYPYQTEISWWIFVLAGLIALVISILTMSYQSVRSASANPIDSIRTE
jgi:putative ABC transport system permease protein